MKGFRYIENITTLELKKETCIGCGNCQLVCPHRVFAVVAEKATLLDANACIECGACAMNCPVGAITVTPGTGCAALILSSWINKLIGRDIIKGCC
ncbi:MAG: mercury methylation ferredoxin HgcB [Candidatus Electrothrix sp. GW3-4]|uniref:mercury methylation ferredoxin HgcB n=1 Tax=Candidatus Electrothrix sp. GW3-4 TaxID=3126740 RepID=UPI0030D28B59